MGGLEPGAGERLPGHRAGRRWPRTTALESGPRACAECSRGGRGGPDSPATCHLRGLRCLWRQWLVSGPRSPPRNLLLLGLEMDSSLAVALLEAFPGSRRCSQQWRVAEAGPCEQLSPCLQPRPPLPHLSPLILGTEFPEACALTGPLCPRRVLLPGTALWAPPVRPSCVPTCPWSLPPEEAVLCPVALAC